MLQSNSLSGDTVSSYTKKITLTEKAYTNLSNLKKMFQASDWEELTEMLMEFVSRNLDTISKFVEEWKKRR